ncbi:MAG: hypothetical protein HKP34_01490 [Nitrosopumilus sp.]|nr:hypothetical protein [Nitrosopumilus sp.]NNL36961.1 hypothetical protein [Nitrosopumilus sp.]
MDIIWGNVGKVLSDQTFELNLTHRKDGNKNTYSDIEKIRISETDFMSLPADINNYTKELVEENLSGVFVKCEIKDKDEEGNWISSVSHSGQGGY